MTLGLPIKGVFPGVAGGGSLSIRTTSLIYKSDLLVVFGAAKNNRNWLNQHFLYHFNCKQIDT